MVIVHYCNTGQRWQGPCNTPMPHLPTHLIPHCVRNDKYYLVLLMVHMDFAPRMPPSTPQDHPPIERATLMLARMVLIEYMLSLTFWKVEVYVLVSQIQAIIGSNYRAHSPSALGLSTASRQ